MAPNIFPSLGVLLRLPGVLFLELLMTQTISSDFIFGVDQEQISYFEVLFAMVLELCLYLVALGLVFLRVSILKKIYLHLLWFLCTSVSHHLFVLYHAQKEALKDGNSTILWTYASKPTELAVTVVLSQFCLCLLGCYSLKCKGILQTGLCFTSMLCWVADWLIGNYVEYSFLHFVVTLMTFMYFWQFHQVSMMMVESMVKLRIIKNLIGWREVLALGISEYEIQSLVMWAWVAKVFAKFCVNFSTPAAYADVGNQATLVGLLFFISVVQCTTTLSSLIGLILFTSRAIKFQFFLVRSWLNGSFTQHAPDPVDVRVASSIDGFTVLIMCIYVEVAELDFGARATFLIYIFLTVLSSQVRTIYAIVDAFLITMATVRNHSIAKHLRTCSLAVLLLGICSVLSWRIVVYFGAENMFWTVVITHNLIATIGLTLSSMAIYFFMLADARMVVKFANIDDVVFYMRGFSEVFEFVLTIVVSLFIMSNLYSDVRGIPGAILLGIYNYYNLMTKGRSGWRAWKMRRNAGTKVRSLHRASEEEKQGLEDVCSICYEEMRSSEDPVCVTNCKHAFHENCLKKWFQIQDKCPICHKHYTETPGVTSESESKPEAPA